MGVGGAGFTQRRSEIKQHVVGTELHLHVASGLCVCVCVVGFYIIFHYYFTLFFIILKEIEM